MTTVTLTLVGATSHLVGFSTFSILEVRHWRPDRAPAPRSLVGPYHQQPAVNTPLELTWSEKTKALFIAGRALERGRDVFVALLPEPGHTERITLTPVPLALFDATHERLAELVNAAPWTEAVTYRGTGAEHEYSRRRSWKDAEFIEVAEAIARGYRNHFRGGWWQQIDVAGFTYWTGYQPPAAHQWINRRPCDREPVPLAVHQELVVEGARVLNVPPLPDGWCGLPVEVTRDRRFQLGALLFGESMPSAANGVP